MPMKIPDISRWSGRIKLALIVLATAELALLAAPPLLRGTVEKQLGQYLQRKIEIRELSLNPLTLSLRAAGVNVANSVGECQLAFEELQVNANLWGSLRHRGIVIDSVALNRPYVYLARLGENRYNISDLIEKFLNQPKSDEPARFSLNNLTLQQGRIVFDDRPQHTRQDVSQLQVSVPFVSNLPYLVEDPVKPSISGLLNGARFASTARAKPFSQAHESTIDISLNDVDVTHYLGYLPTALRFRIASARLDSKLTLSFSQPPEQAPSIALAGKLGLRELKLQQPNGTPLLGWQQAELEIARLEPLQQHYQLRQLTLLRPEVHLQRLKNGQFNLQQAFSIAPSSTPAAAPKPAGPALQLALDSLILRQGQLHWQDDQTGFTTSLTPVDLQLRQFALKPGQATSFNATLRSTQGERLAAQGQFKLQPFVLDGRIEAQQLALPYYAPYYREQLKIRLASGILDGQTQLNIDPPGIRLTQLQLGLSDVRLLPPQGKQLFLTLPALTMQQADIDLTQHKLQIGSIDSSGLQLKLHRNQQGQLDLQQWLAPEASPGAVSAKPTRPAPQWKVELQQLALHDYALDFFDEAPVEDAHIRLSQLQLKARDVSLDKPAAVELSTRINRSGQLRAIGTLRPRPLEGDLRLNASAVELVPLQPYFGHRLNITLTRGNFSGGGKLLFNAEPKTRFSFVGGARVDRLASIDKLNSADFVNWRALQVDGINASDSRVAIERIALNDFYARLLVNPNGRLNLLDIVVNDDTAGATSLTSIQPTPSGAPATATVAAKDKPEPFPVRIGKVQLAGGNVQFSDYFIRPNYSANMTQIGGSISGLSAAADSRATIDLQGSVNNNAQFTLAGSLNPLAKQLFLDIKAGIKGFEMIPTSPYAGKYAGYGINKGKLSMDISYFVEQNRLKAQNHLFLDQLTLGDKVDSPDATSLPVRLALSLLQNRRGEIDLNLPIEGSLDDPQFKLGSVIVQVLKNLLEKAVTAPFALLTSGDGGEELSSIEFEPGSAELSTAAQTRLATLAIALYDRPALKLEIAGLADTSVDREGLKRQMLEQKIRAQKLRQLAHQGQTTEEAQPVSREEYIALLKAVYKDEDFAKPHNLIGLAKDLPVPEMEKLLLDHFDVKPDDLQQLAGRRAFAAKNALIRSGKVEEARLFIVAAKPADNKNLPSSAAGVNFTLAGR